jgi:hypothetical protein
MQHDQNSLEEKDFRKEKRLCRQTNKKKINPTQKKTHPVETLEKRKHREGAKERRRKQKKKKREYKEYKQYWPQQILINTGKNLYDAIRNVTSADLEQQLHSSSC